MTVISTIRPGILVNLKTSLVGNVKYITRDLEEQVSAKKNAPAKAKWETERTIFDPEEHERGCKARTQARIAITRVCASSAFGLLCPEAAAEELDKAIEDARKIADEFNASAGISKLRLYVLCGRIAQNDVEAVRAINSEVSELLSDMESGISNSDVKVIRDAAAKAKAISEMLSIEARTQAEIAIEAARKAARAIAKVEEGEKVSVDRRAMRTIAEARTMFLDLDETNEIEAPKAQGRSLDLQAGE